MLGYELDSSEKSTFVLYQMGFETKEMLSTTQARKPFFELE